MTHYHQLAHTIKIKGDYRWKIIAFLSLYGCLLSKKITRMIFFNFLNKSAVTFLHKFNPNKIDFPSLNKIIR